MARGFSATNTDRISNATFTNDSGSGTISIWIKPGFDSGDSSLRPIWMCGGAGNEAPSFQRYSDNNIYVGFNGGGSGDQRITVADTDLFSSGTWANWVFTFAASGCVIYKNTVSKGTRGATTLFTNAKVTIGNYDSTLSDHSCGSVLMDYAYWRVVLTAGEIAALAQGERPWKIRLADLRLYYPLAGLAAPEPDYTARQSPSTVNGTSFAPGAPLKMLTPLRPNAILPYTTASFRQTHFRFRTDGDAVDATPTWGANEDAA